MSTLFFAELIPGMFLIPLKYLLNFSLSFWLFSWPSRQVSLFGMTVFDLSSMSCSTCSTCSTIWPASSFTVRCRAYLFRVCLFYCTAAILLRSSDRKCCHNTSVVTAHVDHVVGFGIFVVFQVSSLGYDVVDLLLISFRISAGRLFPMILSVHRVECCEALQHQPMIHPITSFVSSVECVFANTCTFCSLSWSQLSIEVSTNDWYAVSVVCRVLLNCSVHFFDFLVRTSRVGEVHTHQFDALVVDHDRCNDGPFVDVFGIDHFWPSLFV